jgi:hypothetical protein
VFVIGVTNDPPTTPYDLRPILQSSIKLQKLTQNYGFTYCGDFTPSSDKVHPNYGPYFDSNVKPQLGTAVVDIIVGDSIATGIANAKFGTSRTGTNRVKASDNKGISMIGARPDEILGYLNELSVELTSTP